jgi:glycosyltransferase involved in cell wall biosynthesis
VALIPKLSGMGGPTTFQQKLIRGCAQQGIRVHFDPNDPTARSILVNGGSKQLYSIWKASKQGKKIVQRLNGMNWIHRKRNTGLLHYLRSEYGNWNLSFIRKNLADYIVYQSNFSKSWWESRYGAVRADSTVIYNGVDLNRYTPAGPQSAPQDHIRLILVEGRFGGGHEQGLLNAIQLAAHLGESLDRQVELVVAGEVPASLRAEIESQQKTWITWAGKLSQEQIPAFDRSAHILFSADLNAACPNSVIEALACGLPVLAFATGSLPEILLEDAGITADYGADHWNLEPPNILALAEGAQKLLLAQPYYRQKARARAEAAFGLEKMVSAYAAALVS